MKKYFYTLFHGIAIITLVTSCSPTQAQKKINPAAGPNLVRDGGFEKGGDGWSMQSAKIVTTQAHSGGHSLQYTNSNKDRYQFMTHAIPAKPGQIVHFSAWVKGQNIAPPTLWKDKGAGIFVQSYDADNKYIGGSFPMTLPGTFDWTEVKGFYPVPANAARLSVGLYMRRESLGTAWFDDVSVQIETPAPFQAYLRYPNYRGITTAQSDEPWQLTVHNKLSANAVNTEIVSEIKDSQGKVLFREKQQLKPDAPQLILRWQPSRNLALGNYEWQVSTTSSNGKPAHQENFPIQVCAAMPRIHIDAAGFTRIDGKRFFPFGVYTGKARSKDAAWAVSDEHLQRLNDAGFNTLLSYGYGDRGAASSRFLADAQAHKLKVIYSLVDLYDGGINFPHVDRSADQRVDKLIEQLKDEPALLGWYTNDEMGYGEITAVQQRYQQFKGHDYRPVLQMQNKVEVLPWDYDSSDVIGSDPYPVKATTSQLGIITKRIDFTMQTANNAKGVWQAVQIHDYSFHKGNGVPPSLDQMRNMTYQNLIGGAKGLLYYAYHWLYLARNTKKEMIFSEAAFQKRWSDVSKMSQEIAPILPIILRDQKVLLPAQTPTEIPYQAWQDDNKLYLMVANPQTQPAKLTVQLPAKWKLSDNKVRGITAQLIGRDLQIELGPIASGVLVLD